MIYDVLLTDYCKPRTKSEVLEADPLYENAFNRVLNTKPLLLAATNGTHPLEEEAQADDPDDQAIGIQMTQPLSPALQILSIPLTSRQTNDPLRVSAPIGAPSSQSAA